MKPIYHVIWSDYDGTYNDRYNDEKEAMTEVGVIASRELVEDYGTTLLKVYYGVEIDVTIKAPKELDVTFKEHGNG